MDNSDQIAIIDLGGQYCHLIKRRLRDLGVESEIHAPDVAPATLAAHAGIILSGGPQSVYGPNAPKVDPALLRLGRPVLGICYGHQLLAKMLGGGVEKRDGEYGFAELSVNVGDTLFKRLPRRQKVWMSHSDAVTKLPRGAVRMAATDRCANAAFANFKKKLFGVQFHPEVVHTEKGNDILRNFVRSVCGIHGRAKPADRVPQLVKQIQETVKNRSVFFLVSGGVDSTVAFALCGRALPHERILGLYIDNGLMRKGETDELRANLASLHLDDRIRIHDASKDFLRALRGVTEPERKREIIGRLFVKIQSQAMRDFGIDERHWLLGQGTIYPDTIESGGRAGRAAVIKTHHNRCAEILELIEKGRVIEPLSEFYKDEVRQLGRALGLAPRLTNRWPFPGPGLAIRCLCSTARLRAKPLSPGLQAVVDAHGYKGVLLPLHSVGVQGDARTYRQVVALRQTRSWIDYGALRSVSSELCNVHTETNRVILLLSGRRDLQLPNAEIRRTSITASRLEILRNADFIVRSMMEKAALTDRVWQFPVVLIPVSFGHGETIVLRPVNSEDGMTANFARLPQDVLKKIARKIAALPGVDAVFLDATNKPPATIEWE
jgi:GMP synthase (glutamine-hydrolysing)